MLGISAGKPYRSGLSLASEKLRLELNIPVDGKVGRITAGEPGRTSRSTSSAMATLTGPQPQSTAISVTFTRKSCPIGEMLLWRM